MRSPVKNARRKERWIKLKEKKNIVKVVAVNHKILRKPVRLPEVSESDPGVGLASTLCLDPWQHSLHLLHILFSFVLDTWQVDLDHFFSLSTTCHHTPLGRSATQFETIGYRRTRLIVQWTTTCPSSGRELRRSIDTVVATRFPRPPSSPPQTWTQPLKLGQADGKRFLFHPADSATLAHLCPLPVIRPTKIDYRLSRANSKWKEIIISFISLGNEVEYFVYFFFFWISTWWIYYNIIRSSV